MHPSRTTRTCSPQPNASPPASPTRPRGRVRTRTRPRGGGGGERRRPGPAPDHPTLPATPFAAAVSGSSRLDLVDQPLDVQMHAAAYRQVRRPNGPNTPDLPPHPATAPTAAEPYRPNPTAGPPPVAPPPPRGTATIQAQTSLVRGASVQRLLLATAVHKRRRSTWSRQLKDAGEPSHRGTRSQPVRGGVRGAGPPSGLQQPAVPGQLGDQRGDPGADGRPLVHPRAHSWHRLEPVSLSSAHLSAMSMPAARRTVQRSFATFQCVNVTKGLSSVPTRGCQWPVGGVRAVLACCCEMSCSCVCAVPCWCCRPWR